VKCYLGGKMRDPSDETLCLLKQVKSNLGPWPPMIGYQVVGDGQDKASTIRWKP